MNCREVRENLELYVLDGLSPDEYQNIKNHMVVCPECRQEEEELRNTVEKFRSSANGLIGESEDFEKLRKHVNSEIDFIKSQRTRHKGIVLKIAALFLVCFGFFIGISLFLEKRDSAKKHCSCKPWQYTGVVPSRGNNNVSPLVRSQIVFALEGNDQNQHIVAIRKRTGDLLWRSDFKVTNYLNADDSRIFAWSRMDDSEMVLLALDQKTGKLLWRYVHKPFSDKLKQSQLLLTEKGVCWTEGNRVILVDARTGQMKWTRQFEARGHLSLPKETGGRIYIASSEALYAINPSDGQTIRKEDSGLKPTFVPPVLICEEDKIFVAQTQMFEGVLRCHDSGTGKLVWTRKTGVILSLQADGQHLFARSNRLLVFNSRTGDPAWETAVSGCSPVVCSGNYVYVTSGRQERSVTVLDPNTGRKRRTIPAESSCSGLVIDGKMGYLTGQNGILYSIKIGRS
ncbi:MAG: PQQ-binding-like beta-propeller repeat protein [Kiritimatiellae bacterium]|nr:PQQ-binding-like beta-propeller repeat protein [Kiritimatiellia bacterium]MDD5523002.1 PQQ-binding-like beta-propeller repeat protein [Kiritimatiellia bacterium]